MLAPRRPGEEGGWPSFAARLHGAVTQLREEEPLMHEYKSLHVVKSLRHCPPSRHRAIEAHVLGFLLPASCAAMTIRST